jgi:hypothetical protein
VLADAPPGAALTVESIRSIFGVEAERLPRRGGGDWIAYGH